MITHASLPTVDPATSTADLSLRERWPQIRAVWRSAPFGAFASLAADGSPQVTPIGSVYLHPTEPRGYYHPVLSQRLRKNLADQSRFELLFVDGRIWNWGLSIVRGRMDQPLAVRVAGHALGERRALTAQEAERWERRMRFVRWTRGYELLWKDVRFVQELAFDRLVAVRFGAMSRRIDP